MWFVNLYIWRGLLDILRFIRWRQTGLFIQILRILSLWVLSANATSLFKSFNHCMKAFVAMPFSSFHSCHQAFTKKVAAVHFLKAETITINVSLPRAKTYTYSSLSFNMSCTIFEFMYHIAQDDKLWLVNFWDCPPNHPTHSLYRYSDRQVLVHLWLMRGTVTHLARFPFNIKPNIKHLAMHIYEIAMSRFGLTCFLQMCVTGWIWDELHMASVVTASADNHTSAWMDKTFYFRHRYGIPVLFS